MKFIYFIFLSVFLLPALSFAQSNYKPGYLVTLKGDTIHGFIDYKEWDNNPKSFTFKKALSQSIPDIFTAKAAEAFAITGQQYYERHVVTISQDPVDVSTMGSKPDTNYLTDTVFLRVLSQGHYAALYSYKDDIKPRFYLSERASGQPYELIYHAFYNREDSSTPQYSRRFRTQLQNLTQKNGIDNQALSREILRSEYTETDLTRVVQLINGNSSKQFTTQGLSGLRAFAGAGVNYSTFKFTGNFELAGLPATSSVAPKIDAGLDFFTNKNIQKFYLRAEMSFTYGQYNFSYNNPAGPPSGTSTLDIKLYQAAFTPQFIYNFYNGETLKAFLDLGISINLASYNNYQFVTTHDSFPTSTVSGYPGLEKHFMTVPLKAGFALKKHLEVYVCYTTATSITGLSATAFRSEITSYQAGLNYFFGPR